MKPRILSLFAGYGGLDMAVEEVTGGTVAYVADIDPGACKVLAHRYPDAPNLGDVTTADWDALVGKVEAITGGSPCQDLSHAGRRAGMTEGTRSNLWVAMREAVATIRPQLVVWENVRGAMSAAATSDLESCPGCMGDAGDRGPDLRALGRVLGDLADLGYDAQWHGLRVADLGGCHGRWRVFVAAYPRGQRLEWAGVSRDGRTRPADGGRAALALLPTPTTRDHKGHNQRGDKTCLTGALLPTPRATDGTKGGPNQRGSSGDLMLPSAVMLLPTPRSTSGGSTTEASYALGGVRDDSDRTQRRVLLPTPYASDPTTYRVSDDSTQSGRSLCAIGGRESTDWGQYAAAIASHERMFGHAAPEPTETGAKGKPRLSASFVEWMMCLPDGWVTDVPGITRNEALRALGNGVVPMQAAHALHLMLNRARGAA